MDNMLEQVLGGVIAFAIFTAFIVYAIYTYRTKVRPKSQKISDRKKPMKHETEAKTQDSKTAPTKIRLNQEAWEKLNKTLNEPPKPTKALRDLMKNN